jgi:hypothetical protein
MSIVNNTRLTVTTSGTYYIDVSIQTDLFNLATPRVEATIAFFKNGSATAIALASTSQGYGDSVGTTNTYPLFKGSTMLTLVANDYIEVKLTNISVGGNVAFPFYGGPSDISSAVQVKAFLVSAASPNISYSINGTIPADLLVVDYRYTTVPGGATGPAQGTVLNGTTGPTGTTGGTLFNAPSGGLNKFQVTTSFVVIPGPAYPDPSQDPPQWLLNQIVVYLRLYIPSTATYYPAYTYTYLSNVSAAATPSNTSSCIGSSTNMSFTDNFNLGTTIPAGTPCYLQLYGLAVSSNSSPLGPYTPVKTGPGSKVTFTIQNYTTL